MCLDYQRNSRGYKPVGGWSQENHRGVPTQSAIKFWMTFQKKDLSPVRNTYNWYMGFISGIGGSYSTVYTAYTYYNHLRQIKDCIDNSEPAIVQFQWDGGYQVTVVVYGYSMSRSSNNPDDIDTIYYWDPRYNYKKQKTKNDWKTATLIDNNYRNMVSEARSTW